MCLACKSNARWLRSLPSNFPLLKSSGGPVFFQCSSHCLLEVAYALEYTSCTSQHISLCGNCKDITKLLSGSDGVHFSSFSRQTSLTMSAGVPTEEEYILMYSKARGIPPPSPAVYNFCLALSFFRIAAILAGIGARAKMGNASSHIAAQVRPSQIAGQCLFLRVAPLPFLRVMC